MRGTREHACEAAATMRGHIWAWPGAFDALAYRYSTTLASVLLAHAQRMLSLRSALHCWAQMAPSLKL